MTAQSGSATPPAFTVTSQMQTQWLGDNGQLESGVAVSFKTAGGHSGTVNISEVNYTVDSVRAILAERAALMDAIGSLQG